MNIDRIYVGTTNPGKVAEIAALLAPLGIEVEPVALDVPELEDTLEGNAREKALAYAAHTGGLTVSEDSGLIVPALGDGSLPGAWSARFADLDLSTKTVKPSGYSREVMDQLNNERVLNLLAGVQMPLRGALFRVVFVIAYGNEVLFETSAECHGWIAEAPRGNNGFGYDPIFVGQNTFGKTFAELDSARKNLRSHRADALEKVMFWFSQQIRG